MSKWSCSACGTNVVAVASLCILNEGVGYKDYCFDCGIKALKQRLQELGEGGVLSGLHFTIPDFAGKKHALINYLPEVVQYD